MEEITSELSPNGIDSILEVCEFDPRSELLIFVLLGEAIASNLFSFFLFFSGYTYEAKSEPSFDKFPEEGSEVTVV